MNNEEIAELIAERWKRLGLIKHGKKHLNYPILENAEMEYLINGLKIPLEKMKSLPKPKGGRMSKKFKEKVRNRMKKQWKNEYWRERQIKKILKGLIKKPNKPELLLIKMFKEQNIPYKYVGNGQFILGGRCPDFLNCNGEKKVIEVFGRTYHSPLYSFFKIPYKRTYQGTKEHYKKYGFKCLIIWDHELKNENDIIEKIKYF